MGRLKNTHKLQNQTALTLEDCHRNLRKISHSREVSRRSGLEVRADGTAMRVRVKREQNEYHVVALQER